MKFPSVHSGKRHEGEGEGNHRKIQKNKTKTKTTAGYQNPEKQNKQQSANGCGINSSYVTLQSQCLQIQFHVQPRTSSFHLMRPPVKSPGSSAMCISVFSEGTSKGLESGGGSEV